MVELMTIEEVAKMLRRSPRSIRRLDIPFIRVSNRRLYDRDDVNAWREERKECLSSNGQTPRIGTQRFRSKDVGLYEALEQHRAVRQKRSSDILRKSLSAKRSEKARRRRSAQKPLLSTTA